VAADCALIEGGAGLFDSRGGPDPWPGSAAGRDFPGSTADVAHIVGAPVLLVLDVSATGETAAAIALGLRQLDADLDIAGVILDRVPSPERRTLVEDAVWHRAKLPVLGAVPGVAVPARLGEAPARPSRPAPLVGEHSAELLRELGLAQAEIERLFTTGAVKGPAGRGTQTQSVS
jgi:cobyrinic acid a,c-diamide synthase